MSDIFISYKREERPRALELATALEREGWSVWWDLELVGGERFDDTIETEINNARCVVVLWSKLSVQSDFVKDEATHALNRGKLLPTRIDDTEVPLRFERLHTIDLSGEGQLQGGSGLGELVEHITKRIGMPAGIVDGGVLDDEAPAGIPPATEEVEPSPAAPEATQPKAEPKKFAVFQYSAARKLGIAVAVMGLVAIIFITARPWLARQRDVISTAGCHSGLQPKDTCRDTLNGDGSKGPLMVVIPGDTSWMGSPETEEQRDSNEGPYHEVTVPSFAMGQHEVTLAQYDAFCEATKRHRPDDHGWGRGNRPAINVSWDDAVAYATWLSSETGKRYRLPSEAEWEYAARAGTTTRYWWGDDIGENRANCDGCGSQWGDEQTAPVGSFGPNPFGLYDTAGNVWEWLQDCYEKTYERAPVDGGAREVPNCGRRAIRGGSWYSAPGHLRSSGRNWDTPSGRYGYLGFRLAQAL